MKNKNFSAAFISVVISSFVSTFVFWVLRYFILPAMTPASGEFWLFILIWVLSFTFCIVACAGNNEDNKLLERIGAISVASSIVLIIVCIVNLVVSGKMANATRYQQLINVNDENAFVSDFSDITEDADMPIAIVDLETARLVGNRTIGTINHASWYEVDDEFNLIQYQGEYYRISPLNYGGLLKYNKANASGLPGYVLVNAKTAEAKYCELEKPFFYSPSGFWSKDLSRHIRNLYPSKQFNKSYFEIDEEGNSYWVTPVYESTIGVWGGKKQISIILTDAVSGQATEYSLDDVPSWIDHNFELKYLTDTVQYHYSFVDGFWNSIVSKTGVYKLAYSFRSDASKQNEEYFEGYTSVIGKNGDVYFYSGLTPANNSESNAGFVMMNCKTGEVTQYNYTSSNAAEESSAQSAAESLVQNFGYQATFPIIVNVGGQETYLMTLKDKAGLVQRYSFCNVQNYSLVVQNETLEKALSDYLVKLGKPNTTKIDENAEIKTKSSIIDAVYSAEIDGTTIFYYKLRNDSKLYKAPITVNELQVTFKEGNRISIEYIESDSDILEIVGIK